LTQRIVNVAAKYKAKTKNKLQLQILQIFTESDNDRKVKEAEANSEIDKKIKRRAEIRNNANSLLSSAGV
jgi:molecular chaperone DnaK (HSP70)